MSSIDKRIIASCALKERGQKNNKRIIGVIWAKGSTQALKSL